MSTLSPVGWPCPSPPLTPAAWETPGAQPGLHPLLSAARVTESSSSRIPVPASGDERQPGVWKPQTLSWGSEKGQRDFLTQPPHFTEEGAVTRRESECRRPPGNHAEGTPSPSSARACPQRRGPQRRDPLAHPAGRTLPQRQSRPRQCPWGPRPRRRPLHGHASGWAPRAHVLGAPS